MHHITNGKIAKASTGIQILTALKDMVKTIAQGDIETVLCPEGCRGAYTVRPQKTIKN